MSCWTRRRFTALLAGTAATAMLPACGSSAGTTITPSNGTATLTFSQFPALASSGGSVVVTISGLFPILVIRTDSANAAALSATCTHAGCILDFDSAANDVHCACHDADFDLSGNVLRGPPPVGLPTYAATVESDAITVQLT